MPGKYVTPPLHEAVCEFRFDPSGPWDSTVPGMYYQAIQSEFSQRQDLTRIDSQIKSESEILEQEVRTTPVIRFSTSNAKSIILLGPHVLAVSRLNPYERWVNYLPMIQHALREYMTIAQPKGIQGQTLRYINHFEIPENARIGDYLRFFPYFDYGGHPPVAAFMAGFELLCDEGRNRLRLQLLSQKAAKAGHMGMIFDLDFFSFERPAFESSAMLSWVENAHRQVEDTFESCVTDRLRDVFGRQKAA
ncbi:MAG: TIGR04255 family protein [Nitrospirae bacterium]|nr:TIGR04255 family protein [Nitrospirota bacterium]